jgi:5-methylcytosine-specific restriction endonuclease McrA
VVNKDSVLKIIKKDQQYYVKSINASKSSSLSGPFTRDEAVAFKKMDHTKRKRYKKKLYIAEIKNRNCEDCGLQKEPYLMTFDHVKDKSFDLADGSKKSWVDLKQEIDKCEIVCRSCHNVREFLRGKLRLTAVEDLAKLLMRVSNDD